MSEKSFDDMYGSTSSERCYTFHFAHSTKHYVIDATNDDGSLARMANHSWKKFNAEMRRFVIEGSPEVVMFAAMDIFCGQEIRYNYGDEVVKESGNVYKWLREIKEYN